MPTPPTSALTRATLRPIVALHIEFSQEREVHPVYLEGGQPDAMKVGPWRPEVRLRVIDAESRTIIEFEVQQDGSCDSTITPDAELTDRDREFLRHQRDTINTLLEES